MERISALIEKLRDQFAEGADIDQLLLTTQLLEGELRYHKQKGTVPASPHVAVLMPNNHYRSGQHYNGNGLNGSTSRPVEPVKSEPSVPVASVPEPAAAAEPAKSEPAPRVYTTPVTAAPSAPVTAAPSAPVTAAPSLFEQPVIPVMPARVQDLEHERYQPQPVAPVQSQPQPAAPPSQEAYNPLQEVPTLAQQIAQDILKDVNEVLGKDTGRSLNEALKGQQKEISMLLTETPIRDLKRAIGINDRYLFISELFRGDEVMYERSIKTINNFSIYQEAYYWMERELKLKLAWDMEKYSSQLFYQLVKRRFS